MIGSRLKKSVDQYLADLEVEGLTRRYITAVRSSLKAFRLHCEAREIGCISRIDLETVGNFLKQYASHSASHQLSVRTHIRKFLERNGNFVMKDYHAAIKGSARTKVRWLTEDQVEQIHQTPMTPEEQIIVLLPLEMGMRPCEVLRLTVKDLKNALQFGELSVIGKTRERPLPVHPDLRMMLENYLAYRGGEDKDQLLPFQRTQRDRKMKAFSEKVGFEVRGYDLRRTWGQRTYRRGGKLAAIMKGYGHKSTDQTLEYIGADRSDIEELYEKTRILNPLIPIKPLVR